MSYALYLFVSFVGFLQISDHTGIKKLNHIRTLLGCNTQYCELGSLNFGTNIFQTILCVCVRACALRCVLNGDALNTHVVLTLTFLQRTHKC
jgi:hypothetical protein